VHLVVKQRYFVLTTVVLFVVRCSSTNVRENSSSFAVHKLLVGSAGPKTVATPVDSLATGFDLAVYRRRMVEVLGTAGEERVINIRRT